MFDFTENLMHNKYKYIILVLQIHYVNLLVYNNATLQKSKNGIY